MIPTILKVHLIEHISELSKKRWHHDVMQTLFNRVKNRVKKRGYILLRLKPVCDQKDIHKNRTSIISVLFQCEQSHQPEERNCYSTSVLFLKEFEHLTVSQMQLVFRYSEQKICFPTLTTILLYRLNANILACSIDCHCILSRF